MEKQQKISNGVNKKTLGRILIIISIAIIIFSFSVFLSHGEGCNYFEPEFGSGFEFLFNKSNYNCEPGYTITNPATGNQLAIGAVPPASRTIPVDFLLIALITGVLGVILLIKPHSIPKSENLPK